MSVADGSWEERAKNPSRDEDPDFGIVVVGHGAEMPFSKGLLSQSLLATAMHQSEAIVVARDIEHDLSSSGLHRIEREALRDLAQNAIRRRLGDEMADRYTLWRTRRDSSRPLVLLLCGTSGVGKTSLSLEVARRLEIGRVQSTDSIRQIMRLLIPEMLIPALHASSYEAHHKLAPGFVHTPGVVDGFRAQAAAVSIGVRASIERTIQESANLVIDGVSLVPDLLDIEDWSRSAEVILMLIATPDEDVLRSRFQARANAQPRRRSDRYIDHLDAIVEIQRHLLDLAERYAIPIVDNTSFDLSVQVVIAQVMSRLRDSDEVAC